MALQATKTHMGITVGLSLKAQKGGIVSDADFATVSNSGGDTSQITFMGFQFTITNNSLAATGEHYKIEKIRFSWYRFSDDPGRRSAYAVQQSLTAGFPVYSTGSGMSPTSASEMSTTSALYGDLFGWGNELFACVEVRLDLRNVGTDSPLNTYVVFDGFDTFPIDTVAANTPSISEFKAVRCDITGNPSDEGQYIRNTIKGAIAPGMGWTPAQHTLRVGYRLQGSADPFTWVNKTGLAAAIDIDEKLDTGDVFAAGSVYEIRCELINNERSITAHASAVLPKAFANLHLSGSGYGVGIGQYSTATEENPMFQCAYPAHFYGGAYDADGNELGASPDIQHGREPTGSIAGGGSRTYTVIFPKPFADIPTVIPAMYCKAALLATIRLGDVTTTGFSATVLSDSTSSKNVGIHWIAIGEFA